MKTFIADIIPKIQRFSQQLDNITLLTNQHWVVIDGIQEGKSVYIFRTNGELIISAKGRVEKAKWELLGKNSILVDMKNESYLFKHGFFDENVLALKIDGREEYAFLLNENRYSGELNSVQQVVDFLESSYLSPTARSLLGAESSDNSPDTVELDAPNPNKRWKTYQSNKGSIDVEVFEFYKYPCIGDRASIGGNQVPDGKYRLGFLVHIHVNNGLVHKMTFT